MGKKTKILLAILIVAILIFLGISVGYQKFKEEPVDSSSIGTIIEDNKDNKEENKDENIKNEINEEINQNEEKTDNSETSNKETEEEKIDQNIDENKTTPPVEKAISLAKDKWIKSRGSTNGVTFGNVTVQGDGKYVVCVSDNITTISICFYVVDLKTGIVEER